MKNEVYFEVKNQDGLARYGELRVGNLQVETPLIFLGYRLGDQPEVWKKIKIEALMPNVYDLLQNNGRVTEVLKKGVHKYLGFSNLIMMDSGGWYFQKKGGINVDVEYVLELEEKARPDIGVVLDFPLDPSKPEETHKRIDYTARNTKYMLEKSKIPIMPTIHGYSKEEIDYSAKKLRLDKPTMLALGSQAALLYPFRVNKIEKIVDTILYVRRKFPNAFLHVFGLGSPRLVPLLFYLGVDSVDAKTWLWKAVRHMIYHNGQIVCIKNDSYSWTPYFDGRDFECNCPVCSKYGFEGLKGERNWRNRAIHNAWKYQQEMKEIRKSIRDGWMEEYIGDRMENKTYRSLFEKIKNKLQKNLYEW
ncbi:MAG: tRNA-guanine transglycosylase [Nitrososphaeria archaeon]|nr:tRNA-guanine transglycosylase [Nitrososphaeria archaeon]